MKTSSIARVTMKGRIASLVALGLALAPEVSSGRGPATPPDVGGVKREEQLVQAAPPPFSDGAFPCSACHDALDQNGKRRELSFHDEQQSIFSHDAEHRWCLDCHDLRDRDVLRLANGDPVPFTESYRLCGQCHGDKLRDWRAGVHGKRVGRWDGDKTYFLCVNCHDPHSPRFKGVKEVVVGDRRTVAPTQAYLRPEPRPKRPEEQRR
jgi:hypothetical protein